LSVAPLDLPVWSVAPFAALLLCIAVLPLLAPHWWHSNRNKGLIAAAAAVPVAVYLAAVHLLTDQQALLPLAHEIGKYISFILLLGSLYCISGGIVLSGDLRPTPLTNAAFLATGAVLANLIGTTGASVVLIRPVLRINSQRQHTGHIPVFFIFSVSNLGGLLTPLGDPPLFLGFLNGVPFGWTLGLWREWLLANGLVLAVFLTWEVAACRREDKSAGCKPAATARPLRLEGWLNVLLLAGIVGAVLLQGVIGGQAGEISGEAVMLVLGLLSLTLTPRRLRQANAFHWGPIIEVAVLFAGIFVAMVPALELLRAHGSQFGVTHPWHYFWLTGGLSAWLDNAPTYLAFATMAAGDNSVGWLAQHQPDLLRAISCGAVFMGALTYIGNGPNFMVKALADDAGYRTPSFVGYLGYSCAVLLPVFALITLLFFRPA
jgi:Na+/H+ antiporter NhaD/arsenite permease-like protein